VDGIPFPIAGIASLSPNTEISSAIYSSFFKIVLPAQRGTKPTATLK
jgi:hypothetical protein